jgi:hypothetical protein
MDRAGLRVRVHDLDRRLQLLAAEYERLWTDLQDALDAGNTYLDPEGAIGHRVMGLATGIPHLGRVFGRQDPPPRLVWVVTSGERAAGVEAVFLSGSRAHAWVGRQHWPELYEVGAHVLEHPELAEEARRQADDDVRQLAVDPADLAEAREVMAEMQRLSPDMPEEDLALGELHYEGLLYVRPVGRGVVLDDTGEELDEAVEGVVGRAIGRPVSGDFVRARLRLEVLADEGFGTWPREPGGDQDKPSEGRS